jgi:hypothetical protein
METVSDRSPLGGALDDSLDPRPIGDGFHTLSPIGRHVELRPISIEDYPSLSRLELSNPLSIRWRLRGTTPGPEQWAVSLWQSVLAQVLVIDRQRDKPIGICRLYAPNFQDGYAYFGAAKFEDGPSPLFLAGIAIFFECVFANWDLRKLYLEVPEYNYPQFASAAQELFVLEGVMREHTFYDGRYWDQLLLTLYRDTWRGKSDRFLAIEGLDDWRDS